MNFQESTTILNSCTKKSGNSLNAPRIVCRCHLSDVRHCASLSAFLSSGPFKFFSRPFQEWFWISYKGDNLGIYPFDEIPPVELGFEKHYYSSDYFVEDEMKEKISSPLVWCPLLIFPCTSIFLFSKCSKFFLIWSFFSFHCLSFSPFHYQHDTFFNARFHSCIMTVYFYCLY